MLRNVEVSYGELPEQVCKLHGGEATRFGTLVDPNGHRWLICAGCINSLWGENQWIIREEEVDRRARQLLEERLLGRADDV